MCGEAFVVLAPFDLWSGTTNCHADEDGSGTTDHILILRWGDDARGMTWAEKDDTGRKRLGYIREEGAYVLQLDHVDVTLSYITEGDNSDSALALIYHCARQTNSLCFPTTLKSRIYNTHRTKISLCHVLCWYA